MYNGLLDLHNLIRWAVVLLGVIAIVVALGGARWTPQQNSLGRWFSLAFDVQVLIGIVLLFVSPLATSAFADLGAAMGDPALRRMVIEHPVLMVIAAVLVHVGVSRGRKADSPRTAAIFYLLAAAVVAYAIPWDRPLIPGM
jgi:hypothetical protein